MTKLRQDAITFAHRTGIDRLGAQSLELADAGQDGELGLPEAVALAQRAALDGDARMQADERARVQAVLGDTSGAATLQPPVPGAIRSILNARSAPTAQRHLPSGLLAVKPRDTAEGMEVWLSFTRLDADDTVMAQDEARVRVPGLHLAEPVACEPYDRDGNIELPSDANACFGAGALLSGVDPHLGVVLIDVAAREAIQGGTPDLRSVGTLDDIKLCDAVQGLAREADLDLDSLELTVDRVELSGTRYPLRNHLNLALQLRDGQGSEAGAWVHAELKGSAAAGLDHVEIGELEPGRGAWDPEAATQPTNTSADDSAAPAHRGRDLASPRSSRRLADVAVWRADRDPVDRG